jgi:hypothetical protein
MIANQDYLVPYRTAFLLYITVRGFVSWPAFTMVILICKVFYQNEFDKTGSYFRIFRIL